MNFASLTLFETLDTKNDLQYLIIDESVAVKPFFLDALTTLAPYVPEDYDILFLDCPSSCNTVGSVGVTRVDESCSSPGGHAYIIKKESRVKVLSYVLPLRGSWALDIGKHADVASYCLWPHLAEIVPQWMLWRIHV